MATSSSGQNPRSHPRLISFSIPHPLQPQIVFVFTWIYIQNPTASAHPTKKSCGQSPPHRLYLGYFSALLELICFPLRQYSVCVGPQPVILLTFDLKIDTSLVKKKKKIFKWFPISLTAKAKIIRTSCH